MCIDGGWSSLVVEMVVFVVCGGAISAQDQS